MQNTKAYVSIQNMTGEIKNPYGLRTEFLTKQLVCDYLTRHNFKQDPYVMNAWYNELSMVDAHVSKVRELNGSESYLATYWAAHIERMRGAPKSKLKDVRHIKQLAKVNVSYAQ